MLMIRGLKLLLIAIAVILTMVMFAIIFGLLMQSPQVATLLAIVVAIGLFILVVSMIATTLAARRRRAAAVLSYLEQAVRHNLPLPRIVRAIGEGENGGKFSRDMIAAQQALQEGAPLAVVLSAIPQIPSRVIAVVAGAERVGRLPQVLGRLMEQRRAAISRGLGFLPFYRVYPLALGLVFVTITSMFTIFVAPKFEQLFRDFHLTLPPVTQVTLEVARGAGPWVAMLLMLVMLSLILAGAASRWRGAAYGLVEGPFDWLANRLPGIGRARLHRALGEALEFTADAIASGRTMETALMEAGQITGNSRLREMFARWMAEVSRGRSLSDAARSAGLPAMVCSMLATASQTPDIAQVLRFLGRYYSTRFSRAVALLQASVVPLIALVMGSLVAWLALSVFLPLVRLIDRLAFQSGMS